MRQTENNMAEREAQLLRAPPTSSNKIVMWDELVDLLREQERTEGKIMSAWFHDLKSRILDGHLQFYVKPRIAQNPAEFLSRLAQSSDEDFEVLSGCFFDSDRLATHGRLFDTAFMHKGA